MRMSVIASVASAYYELVGLDKKLEIVTNTLVTRQKSVNQAKLRAEGGLTSGIPYQQALVELASTEALVPDLQKQIALKESELCFITGSYPKDVERGLSLIGNVKTVVPSGVLSDILRRRPDLMQSENALRAAEARVGVAMAEGSVFTINLGAGEENNALKDFLKSPFWFTGATLASPVFEFGKRRSALKAAVASYEQTRLEYEKDVMQAFKEVYDATVTFRSARSNTDVKVEMERASKEICRAGQQPVHKRCDQLYGCP